MTTYVCFDIGNVLCHCSFEPLKNLLSDELNITLEEAGHFIARSQKLHDLGLTNLGDELRDHFKLRSETVIKRIMTEWDWIVQPEFHMTELLHVLTEKGVKIALLSNIGLEHVQTIERFWSESKFYQQAIKHFSCQIGARKPTGLYYQSFLNEYPEFKGALYLDDLQENVDAGLKYGLKAWKFALDAQSEVEIKNSIDRIKQELNAI
jgi:FMN phosphatase YigB (HAD superfamily)